MIEGANPVVQALLGTLLTWALTAAGAACVILVIGYQRKILDGALGFAAGEYYYLPHWFTVKPVKAHLK
uniref:Uncharacterized protein n=1 Tax=Megaselia scalaris TaxID=36166 RepID=T1GES1_MEGSC